VDFILSPEQTLLKDQVRKLARSEFAPRAEACDREERFPAENVRRLSELGLMGLCLPEAYGGQGLSTFEFALVLEELAQACAATAGVYLIHAGVSSRAIAAFAPEPLKKKYLPRLATGELLAAFAMTEPEAGSAATDLRTRAALQGDHYLVNGTKRFISNGGEAQVFTTVVRLEDRPGAKGLGALVIDRDSPGFSVPRIEEKMGLGGFSSAELLFEDCRVPAENLLLPAGQFGKMMQAFNSERCGNSAVCLGLAQAALDLAVDYAKVRKQFGRELAEFQGLQWMLAEMKIKVEAMRSLLYRAATSAEPFPEPILASITKAYCNETVNEVVSASLQIHGGYGYMKEAAIERLYRDARAWALAGGTVQIQKNTVAGLLLDRKLDQRK
jgi:alkylation response protein AidB-like acyl-CoA dehydrogenase